jgi:hypothetical protein
MQKPITITFRVTDELCRKWKHKVPKEGDRSHVLRQLIGLYVEGKVQVAQPQKP